MISHAPRRSRWNRAGPWAAALGLIALTAAQYVATSRGASGFEVRDTSDVLLHDY
ncbi:hypothetical protein Bcav_0170 [Beutenbergia cavernae DSM 12333]|uniref:Uncharacterized protein n=1 Tax=Beutenbergia cavernae (strain ATCC BAA-8 / DSM 12333 / CCUG 43141 / JCM 11478 / NBRC 16432 / NCIMB 13614 / HKI 0122) TaxID=471853 RepID=C5BVJ5_BEUC1|nr:hypothetical protein [Beutenbergia cavernae]ACQ78435.1 hypothetical protein Bcav_0170 [Beutenbergia cavernae DSM 12333]